MRWVRAHDAAGRVLALPNQTPGLLERYRITREDADREVWAVDITGRTFGGAAAINRVLVELAGPWARLGAAYRLPPVRWAENLGYAWVARNRHRFTRWGVTPECQEPGVSCG